MGSSGDFVSYQSIIFPVVAVIGVMSLELGICHHVFGDVVRNLTEITGFVLDFVILDVPSQLSGSRRKYSSLKHIYFPARRISSMYAC